MLQHFKYRTLDTYIKSVSTKKVLNQCTNYRNLKLFNRKKQCLTTRTFHANC